MRVTNMLPDIQYQMQQSQQALATATEQLSTGLRVNQLSDDPAASANMVVSLAASADVDQFTSNVTSVLPRMQTADSAISSIVTSLNSAVTLGTEGANGSESTQDRQEIASQVQSILSDAIAQANTSYSGAYLFGGSESTTPPFVAASTTYNSSQGSGASPLATNAALTAGSVTSISDATTGETMTYKAAAGDTIATLQSAIASAVSAGTLSAGISATINANGQLSIGTNNSADGIVVSSNDPVLGTMNAASGTEVANAYAYVGNSSVNTVQIGDTLNVATNVPGNQLFTSGPNVLGSLSNLISSLQSGTTTQIGAAAEAVTTALNYLDQQRVPLDNTMSQLNDQESFLGQEKVTLTTQQTALVGINMADAATNLSQAQMDNSSVLAAAAKILPQTLLQYLQ
jgi:flagellar hook-associated protein 3 FlgL